MRLLREHFHSRASVSLRAGPFLVRPRRTPLSTIVVLHAAWCNCLVVSHAAWCNCLVVSIACSVCVCVCVCVVACMRSLIHQVYIDDLRSHLSGL